MLRRKITGTEYELIIANYHNDENGNHDRVFIRQNSDLFFDILKRSYEEIGGCLIYEDPEDMVSKARRYSVIVKNDGTDDIVVAVCTFRRLTRLESFKGILIGGNYDLPDEERIEGVRLLVQHMIVNWDKLYWIECSGPIEHWFDKFGGIQIPIGAVPEILQQANISGDIIADQNKGENWYVRTIKGGWDVSKRMYGFASRDILESILDEKGGVINEEKIRKLIKPYHSLRENYGTVNFKGRKEVVYKVLNYVDDAYFECGSLRVVSQNLYDILMMIYEDGVNVVSRLDKYKDEDEVFEFNMLLRSLKTVLRDTTVIGFKRFY